MVTAHRTPQIKTHRGIFTEALRSFYDLLLSESKHKAVAFPILELRAAIWPGFNNLQEEGLWSLELNTHAVHLHTYQQTRPSYKHQHTPCFFLSFPSSLFLFSTQSVLVSQQSLHITTSENPALAYTAAKLHSESTTPHLLAAVVDHNKTQKGPLFYSKHTENGIQ